METIPAVINPRTVWSVVETIQDIGKIIGKQSTDDSCLSILLDTVDDLREQLRRGRELILTAETRKYEAQYVLLHTKSDDELQKLLPGILEAASSIRKMVPRIDDWRLFGSYNVGLCTVCGLTVARTILIDPAMNKSISGICRPCYINVYYSTLDSTETHRQRIAQYRDEMFNNAHGYAVDTIFNQRDKNYKKCISYLLGRIMYHEFAQMVVGCLYSDGGPPMPRNVF